MMGGDESPAPGPRDVGAGSSEGPDDPLSGGSTLELKSNNPAFNLAQQYEWADSRSTAMTVLVPNTDDAQRRRMPGAGAHVRLTWAHEHIHMVREAVGGAPALELPHVRRGARRPADRLVLDRHQPHGAARRGRDRARFAALSRRS